MSKTPGLHKTHEPRRSPDTQPGRALAGIVMVTAIALMIMGCNGNSEPDAGAPLLWYATCGDPVCGGYSPDPADTLCSNQTEGETCTPAGAECTIVDDDCNRHLLCTDSDPAVDCPISLARFKRDIRYLSPGERDDIMHQLLATKLATYHYRDEPDSAPSRLGFIIDDEQPDSRAVLPNGQRVDLYGYTSMAVAAIQAQAEQIRSLQEQVRSLRDQVEAFTNATQQESR